jgi:peptide/nickel transport system permease protein
MHPRLRLPLALVAIILIAPFAVPPLLHIDPNAMSVMQRFGGPSLPHPLGLDEFGRDRLARVLIGAQASLRVALFSTLISCAVGSLVGLLGAYFRGVAGFFATKTADVVLCFPPILLALLVVTLLGPGTTTLIWVLSIIYFPAFARIVFLETSRVSRIDYVVAAEALGARPRRIMFQTILPNISGPIIVQFSLTAAAAIITESGLSYLGLGVVPPDPSWGQMIRGARAYMEQDPLGIIIPCVAISLTIWGVNLLTDRLRDVLDPKGLSGSIPLLTTRRRSAKAKQAPAPLEADTFLRIDNLEVTASSNGQAVKLIEGVSLRVRRGCCTALVGESGSGKSLTAASVMGLLPRGVTVTAGDILLRSADDTTIDVSKLSGEAMEAVRGQAAAMIFQEPMTALNPVYRVGDQLIEAARAHRSVSAASAREEGIDFLTRVGVNDPVRRFDSFPHMLSGGLRQRVMIAMALSMKPGLLLADEPTTALDVTVQAEIIDLLIALKNAPGAPGILFISHDLGVVAQLADEIAVMYAGRVVEQGPVAAVLGNARHPYTRALLQSMPAAHEELHASRSDTLPSIGGTPPLPRERPAGCVFRDRCPLAMQVCAEIRPQLAPVDGPAHLAACHLTSGVAA